MITASEFLLINLITAAIMTGVIWVVQLLHYPAFAFISATSFTEFHQLHTSRITWIVAPVMLIELATSALLLLNNSSSKILLTNLILVILIWLSTFLLSVPMHNKLVHGQDLEVIRQLVQSNWPRTILWSLRLVLMSYFTLQILRTANA